jgi:ABC-type antimicrobial peptide transport system permease subunit
MGMIIKGFMIIDWWFVDTFWSQEQISKVVTYITKVQLVNIFV